MIYVSNRKAKFEYHIIDTYKAGIVLNGPEVKSIRDGNASIEQAYCIIHNNELFIRGMFIKPYKKDGIHYTNEAVIDRKLLVTKKEIKKLSELIKTQGLTIVPLLLSTTRTNLIKLDIGLCKGKKLYDKRQTIRERDLKKNSG